MKRKKKRISGGSSGVLVTVVRGHLGFGLKLFRVYVLVIWGWG